MVIKTFTFCSNPVPKRQTHMNSEFMSDFRKEAFSVLPVNLSVLEAAARERRRNAKNRSLSFCYCLGLGLPESVPKLS